MNIVFAAASVSLDGFVAGPGDKPGCPYGEGGESLHAWRRGGDPAAAVAGCGAVILGRHAYDTLSASWDAGPPYGAPLLVLTHEPWRPGPVAPAVTFVRGGPRQARDLALAACEGKPVAVAGGATAIKQFLLAGLLDELRLDLVHRLLGEGVPLFGHPDLAGVELEQIEATEGPGVTHLRFRCPGPPDR